MRRFISISVLVAILPACSGDPSEDATATSPTSVAATETSSTSAETTGEPQPESTTESSTTSDVETTTEEGDDDTTSDDGYTPYQACIMGECPEEADECHTYVAHVPVHYCTVFCESAAECPASPGGLAEPQCDPYLTYGYCALDCSAGKSCPMGMGCFDVTLVDQTEVRRCGWVDE
jgi:hypothetical protein